MLDVKNKEDWDLLKPLLERFDIAYERVLTEDEKRQNEEDWEIIMKGAHDDNFDEFYVQWKEDRKDNKPILSEEEREKNWEILMEGVKFENFDKFMKDFEEYRKDPVRPFRD